MQWRKNIYINLLGHKKNHNSHHNWHQNSWRTRSVSPNWRGSSSWKAVFHIPGSDESPKLRQSELNERSTKKNAMCDVFLSRHDWLKPPSNYILEVVDGSEPFPALKSSLPWIVDIPRQSLGTCLIRLSFSSSTHPMSIMVLEGPKFHPHTTFRPRLAWPRHRPVVALNRTVRWTADEHNRLPSPYPWNKMTQTQSLAKIH